ncbi:hypothetical protein DXC51_19000 [Eisenbergiella massiliensis]|uniref:Uncharacterized protein n=1 Tax=Eisenbergiella massiliensis TaxID=1720294 RepID=A0A3E3HZX8_9FIRM|nr:hypothetical protein DXC51_19000 [Eisenbergiella massiliensis]
MRLTFHMCIPVSAATAENMVLNSAGGQYTAKRICCSRRRDRLLRENRRSGTGPEGETDESGAA